MAKTYEWYRWYHTRFMSDPFVKTASAEAIGVYILLLHEQISAGGIPDDIETLHALVGHQISLERFAQLWEEKLQYKFTPLTQRWVSDGPYIDTGRWEDLKEQPQDERGIPLLHNRMMSKSMATTERAMNVRSDASRKAGVESAALRQTKSLEERLSDDDEADPPKFNFYALLKLYPPRDDRKGVEEGHRLMKVTITDEESYTRLEAAIRAYRKQRMVAGEDRKYTLTLVKFMQEWSDHVPRNFVYDKADQAEEKAKVKAAPAKVEYKDTADRLHQLRNGGILVDRTPWEPRGNETPEQMDKKNSEWPEEKRVSWLDRYLSAN